MNQWASFQLSKNSRDNTSHNLLHGMFQQYVDATPVGILVVNDDGILVFVNQSLCTLFQYQRDELIGQPIEILVPDWIRPDHVQLRNDYIENPKQRMMIGREVRGRQRGGIEVEVAIGLNPIVMNGTVHVAGTVMDLTPIKQAETTLSRFFDLSLDLFCIASTSGYFLRINPNFSRLLGFSDDELLKRPFLEFVHPDDIEATQAAVALLDVGQPVVRFRNRYGRWDGGYRCIEWSARGIPEDGSIFAVGRDVTDETKLTRELQVRDQRERAILENTPAVVFIKDIQGRFLYVNQRYVELFQSGGETLIGKTDHDIFPKELSDKFVENDRAVAATQETLTIQETALRADGKLRTYLSVKFPLLDANGAVEAVAGIATDLTEQLQAQQVENQLKLAEIFQQKLFPEKPPSMPGIELAGSARPVSKLCGDYYDYIITGPDRIVLAVGDVSGHGIGPALVMVEVRSILRGLMSQGASENLVMTLKRINQLLASDLPEGAFVSLFLAEIDLRQNLIRYAGAGHGAFVFQMGQRVINIDSTGPILGAMESINFEEVSPIVIREGDVLLISTDGVTEAMNPRRELYGAQRLEEFVLQRCHKSPNEIIQDLFADVSEFALGRPISDDMTVVVAKIGNRQMTYF